MNALKQELIAIKVSTLSAISKEMQDQGSETLYKTLSGKSNKDSITIYGAIGVHWANIGRKPGKMPPVKPIKAWMKRKGIPKEAIWGIRKKIARDGTVGKRYLDILPNLYSDIEKRLGEAFRIDAEQNLKFNDKK